MIDEGYIKFNIEHRFEKIEIPEPIFTQLSNCRTQMFDRGWIGETPEGIGFGNISVFYDNRFFITGSATGAIRELSVEGYAEVLKFDIEENCVESKGMAKASSETMSHAVIYKSKSSVRAVIHIHNTLLWENNIDKLPTTAKEVPFGTPQMAHEIQRIINNPDDFHKGIIIMGGHQDGIISYGETLNAAAEKLLLL